MTSAPPAHPSSTSAAVESIKRSLSELCVSADEHRFSFENPRRFSAFANRLQVLLIHQLLGSVVSPDSLPAAATTALKGIAADLSTAAETASLYAKRSKIFVLVHCQSLRESLQKHTLAIAAWLALLDSALADLPDLRKKIADLSRDMKQAQFIVPLSSHALSLSIRIQIRVYGFLKSNLNFLAGNGERRASALHATEGGARETDEQSGTERDNHGLSASSRDRFR